jgi:predicted Zn-dependent protease
MTAPTSLLQREERDALVVLGHLHLEQSRPEEAACLLRPLHRALPGDAEVERCLAVAELQAGNHARAARLAAHAYTLAARPARDAMGLVYAKALWLAGNEAASREALAKVIAQRATLDEG